MGASNAVEAMVAAAEAPSVPPRLNVFLSERARLDLQRVAAIRKTTLTEVVRLGLALAKIAVEEAERGNKLMITDKDGRPLREIILPG